jgi:DNA-binding NarL/FixJ family response regulator
MERLPGKVNPITIGIVDDHKVLVEALRLVIQNELDMEVTGEAGTCAECLELVKRNPPNILVLDLALPDGNGLSLVPQINQISPEIHILVLTAHSDQATLMQAIDLGVTGFVGKNQRLTDVMVAIRQAATGEITIPLSMLLGLLGQKSHLQNHQQGNNNDNETLTPREHEILTCLALGESGPEIAHELNITPLTVRTHIRNIIDKFGVHSRLEAVSYALRQGLIDSPL